MNEKFVWERYKNNPVFPTVPGTWMESQTANPDLLALKDAYIMYFRGQQGGHDRIGLAMAAKDNFDGKTWNIHPNPVIDVGEPGSWDETHALDAAAVWVSGQVFLYYSAVCPRCERSICLATSSDSFRFRKQRNNPILIGGSPEIVFSEGAFYLFFWKPKKTGPGFSIHLATSRDGFHFSEPFLDPVVSTGPDGAWDSRTVETPRIFKEDGMFYMMYSGSDRYDDYPSGFGVAT